MRKTLIGLTLLFLMGGAFWSGMQVDDGTIFSRTAERAGAVVFGGKSSSAHFGRREVKVYSGLLNFDLKIFDHALTSASRTGKISSVDEGILISKHSDGTLTFFDFKTEAFRELFFRLPALNHDLVPPKNKGGREIKVSQAVRYADTLVHTRDGARNLLVSYTHYDQEGDCITQRIAETALPDNWLEPANVEVAWTEKFVSRPCIPVTQKGRYFNAMENGGILLMDGAEHVLLTIGDFAQDGIAKKPAITQSDASDYGRVLRLSLSDFSIERVSMGHRNPQGLAFDNRRNLWLVEHGPMGGDELNHIQKNKNYGWPYVTYGVRYTKASDDNKHWPFNAGAGRHEGYDKPAFYWTPSIATHSLVHLHGFHDRWDGDLLIGTLKNQSLVRVRLEGTTVIGTETVPIGHPIRDIELADGKIYLLLDNDHFGVLTPRPVKPLQN